MIHKLFLFCLLIGLALQTDAQTFSISGTVKDKQGVLPGASIYLSNYKNATSTNSDGKFVLNNLKAGNYDVLVQMMGYLPFTRNVIISDKSVNIDIILKDNTILLNEVVIRTDPNRERYLNMFKEFFIGKTPNAEKCKILNPAVLNIDYDDEARTLTVKSNDFLVIENKALGYKLRYMLQFFEYNYKTRIVYYAGLPTFEDLKGSKSKMRGWVKNRETAYYGSSQQFFKSLYAGTTKEDGFIINKMIKIPNEQRPADSIINKNIKRLTKSVKTVIRIGSAENDSLMYWSKVRDMPKNISILNRADVLTDTLVRQEYKNLKTMNFKDQLYVIYTKERESVEYTNMSGHSVSRPLDVPNYEISIINMLEGPLHFYENGGIYEPRSILYEGYWAYEKIADMVPMDYIPITKK
ncbi:carboxypeptidase-like regulatory domain-containing protein [Pedobacter duraquae]|uniref:Carboxypeptidase-like protein n=1 Tax=Pedobacter duraquae TaxID=425511 RepID=A0A4V3C3H5_9SPHI|nr:carboxypeptidase-like regulatory domain-containing protein [Pedobacter duraquae]TDO22078.1 carboxypeptidase-like protein [Pedobacter duraquae]